MVEAVETVVIVVAVLVVILLFQQGMFVNSPPDPNLPWLTLGYFFTLLWVVYLICCRTTTAVVVSPTAVAAVVDAAVAIAATRQNGGEAAAISWVMKQADLLDSDRKLARCASKAYSVHSAQSARYFSTSLARNVIKFICLA